MKEVGLFLDLYFAVWTFAPAAAYPWAPPALAILNPPLLLFAPPDVMEPLRWPEPPPFPLAALGPNRFGYLREFKICCVFIALE